MFNYIINMGTEFAQNYERALSGYTQSAGEINGNIANYRSDVDMVRQANKSGLANATSAANSKVDMDAIKGVADEFGLQGGKKLYDKYITKGILDYKPLGNRSFNEFDKDLGNRIKSGLKNKLGIGESKDDVGAGSDTFENFVKKRFGGSIDEATERLNNLRSSAGETKSDIQGLVKERVGSLKATGADEGIEMQPTDDLTNSNSLLPRDEYGRDAPETSGLTDADKGRVALGSDYSGETKVPEDEPVVEPDPPVVRNAPLSDRIATPKERPKVSSFEELQTKFQRLKGGEVELGDVGGDKPQLLNQSSQGFNDFDSAERDALRPSANPAISGTYNSQSTLQDFRRQNPSIDGLGGGSGDANQVGIRNAASNAERSAQDGLSSARSGIAGASQTGEDMANGAKNAASDLADTFGSKVSSIGNMGQQALADGQEGLGSGLSKAKNFASDLLKGGGAATGEEEAGGALEAIGGIIDATPLAPLGWLFGAIGGGLDVAAGYQAVKGVADWVSDDILGNHPAVNFKKTATPGLNSVPKTFSITPTMDSTMDIGSGGGSW